MNTKWAAVMARDKAADGQFYYSVRTTGVYCKPSCGARLPRPENVGFHDSPAAAEALGFRPCKRCRPEERVRFALREAELGWQLVGRTKRGVCWVSLGDSAAALEAEFLERFPGAAAAEWEPELAPLDLRGTPFQLRVWEALLRIPTGTTISYAQLAAAIGAPRSVRAVARACAANQVALAVPCHRVVGTNGELTGYRWGVERKQAILAQEARA